MEVAVYDELDLNQLVERRLGDNDPMEKTALHSDHLPTPQSNSASAASLQRALKQMEILSTAGAGVLGLGVGMLMPKARTVSQYGLLSSVWHVTRSRCCKNVAWRNPQAH